MSRVKRNISSVHPPSPAGVSRRKRGFDRLPRHALRHLSLLHDEVSGEISDASRGGGADEILDYLEK